jgi:protein HIRA/HIR1
MYIDLAHSRTSLTENNQLQQAFNPLVCFPKGKKREASSASSMVALGADDNSISIWRNTNNVPTFVAKDVFDRQILDLCW